MSEKKYYDTNHEHALEKLFINRLQESGYQYVNVSILNIYWVELRTQNGFRRFKKALEKLNIPHQDFQGDLEKQFKRYF